MKLKHNDNLNYGLMKVQLVQFLDKNQLNEHEMSSIAREIKFLKKRIRECGDITNNILEA